MAKENGRRARKARKAARGRRPRRFFELLEARELFSLTPTISLSYVVPLDTPIAPTVNVSDSGGPYSGSTYAATATVAGIGSQSVPAASLEGTTPTLAYYSGSAATGAPTSTAPSTAGTYTVVASFAGSTDYATASASTTFAITPVAPNVRAIDVGGPYTGSQYAASGVLVGVGSQSTPSTNLEGVTPTFSYYSGSAATGAPLASAPSALGTYTVVASFAGSTDYSPTLSSPVTFAIAVPTTMALSSSASSVTFGQGVTLTATVETVPPNSPALSVGTVTFRDGSTTLGTVSVNSNTATLTNVVLSSVGIHSVSAVYSGSAANNISGSATAVSPSSIIITYAGSANLAGDGGPATLAAVDNPGGIAIDSAGNIYIADTQHNAVREVNHVTGLITTFAGTGLPGTAGNGGPASAAQLSGPTGLAFDENGDLYIADTNNDDIREVFPSGLIATVVGTGSPGFYGDGGPANSAALDQPTGLAIDSLGDLFIADTANNRVREFVPGSGLITTVAGNGGFGANGDGGQGTLATLSAPLSLAVSATGNLFIADSGSNRIRELNLASGIIVTAVGNGVAGFLGDGFTATAAELSAPTGLALDSAGDLFIADAGNERIREVNFATEIISTVAGTGLTGYGGDGIAATAATLDDPLGLAVDSSGDVLIADSANNLVREVNFSSQLISTLAGNGSVNDSGDGHEATYATLATPQDMVVDSAGDLFIADSGDSAVREVNHATGVITTVAGTGIRGNTGNGGPATAAELGTPDGLLLDSTGDLYIADAYDGVVREVNLSTGTITTIAGNGTNAFNGDNIPATAAALNNPAGLALDSAGDLFIADTGNARIREVVAATGLITTFAGNGVAGYNDDGIQPTAAELDAPAGLTFDSAGDLFIADAGNNRIREVNASTGTIVTVAGNGLNGYAGDGRLGILAALSDPLGVAFDSAGDLFIADAGNSRIREVAGATGIISTLAGFGSANFGGDGSAASMAYLNGPAGVAVDAAGNIFIADAGNDRVREMIVLPVTVTRASSSVAISDSGGMYNGSPFAATATVNSLASLELVAPALTYYSGTLASGSPLTAAPSQVGTYTVVASFAGSLDYLPSKSSPVTFSITPIPTAVSLSTSSTIIALGQTVTLTATVSATPTPNQGTVTFSIPGTNLGTAPVTGGVATLITALPMGVVTVNAVFTDSTDSYATSTAMATPGATIISLAGAGNYSGDGGQATLATLNQPAGIAVDSVGDIFIADAANNVVRELNHVNGVISTIAGTGTAGYNGDNIPALAAELTDPQGLAVDAAGDLFIADGNNRIREVNHVTGVITTVAGTGVQGSAGSGGQATAAQLSDPTGLAIDSSGDLFIADQGNNRVLKVLKSNGVLTTVAGNGVQGFSGDRNLATAAELARPNAVAVDSAGNVYISDGNNDVIREVIAATGVIKTIAGTGQVAGFSGDGLAPTAAKLNHPSGVVLDSIGDIFIADEDNNRIREINATTGLISTAAGTGNPTFNGDNLPATAANLTSPEAIVLSTAGNLLIADSSDNRVREVLGGQMITIAGNSYATLTGNNGPATAADLSAPEGIAVDSAGDVFFADTADNVIREINRATGVITTVAGTGGYGLSGDTGPATLAQLKGPQAVALDSAGNLYIADTGNNRIREVNHVTGVITTIAGTGFGYNGDNILAVNAELLMPAGVAVDSAGDVFIADQGNNRIREVNHASGLITTVVGNGTAGFAGNGTPATAAELNGPQSVALDSAGDIYFVDHNNQRVREVNATTGNISTVAGTGVQGLAGDGGPATAAQLNAAVGITVDTFGDVFIADQGNNRIREVNAATGLISTFAGSAASVEGNGGPASAAGLLQPQAVAFDSLGNLYIADTSDNQIREVVAGVVVNVGFVATVSVNDASGTYNGSGFAATAAVNNAYTLQGVAATIAYYSGSAATGAPLAAAPSHAGTYTVVASFAGSVAYPASQSNPLTFVISPAPLTISANSQAMVVGNALPTLTASYAGFAGTDSPASLTVQPALATTATQSSSPGSYPITVSVAVDPDYSITFVPGTLTVDSPPHTPSVTNATAIQNSQSTSGLVITPDPEDSGVVTNFQITNITGGTLYLNDGLTPVTNGEFITVAQGAAGLKFTPAPNSSASGSFDVQASVGNTAAGLGGSLVAATISVTVVPPSSSVTALGYRTSQTSIPVSWSSTAGSGGAVVSYNIEVSTDGGAFTPWLTATSLTSSTFTAQSGHTYGFVSQAKDAAGNLEAMRTTADTTITVTPTPWQNPHNPLDVLGSGGLIVPEDALLIIDYLNLHPGNGTLPNIAPAGSAYYDVLGTNQVVPNDALQVINYLNLHPAVQVVSSAESPAPAVAAPPNAAAANAASPTAALPGTSSNSLNGSPTQAAAAVGLLAEAAEESGNGAALFSVNPAAMAIAPAAAAPLSGTSPNTGSGLDDEAAPSSGWRAALSPSAPPATRLAADTLFSESSDCWGEEEHG